MTDPFRRLSNSGKERKGFASSGSKLEDARMDTYILALRAGDGPLKAATTAGVTPKVVNEWRQADPIFDKTCQKILDKRAKEQAKNAKNSEHNGEAVRKSLVTVNAQAASGLPMPLDVLLSGMRMVTTRAEELNSQPLEKGETEEERVLKVMTLMAEAIDIAHKAAPYCHPRLAALRVEQEHEDTHETIDVEEYLEGEAISLGLPSFRSPTNGNGKSHNGNGVN